MSFNSIDFLWFFPLVALIYYVIPYKARYIWLLVASYYFYMSWNAKYVLLIAFATVITYCAGVLLDLIAQKDNSVAAKKIVVAAAATLNLGMVFYFKYIGFAAHNLCKALSFAGIIIDEPQLDILLPVGISFFTFQAVGYVIDVYRGNVRAEKNILKYALFVSFFPQLVAGPIERSSNLLHQFEEKHKFDLDRIRDGLLTMLWGYFLKIVLADRLGMFIDGVFGEPSFGGYYLILACVLFAFQIYCDFNGYTMIARGAAQIMGFSLIENFNAPYMAGNVADFWRRWHISLTSWFRDYVYIPLGGNRKGDFRRFLNILIVFSLSGLWHGADWGFIIWGALNGLYQVIGAILKPARDKAVSLLKLNRESFGHRLLCMAGTFVLVDFSWIFFRAAKLSEIKRVIGEIFTASNPWILFDHESLYLVGMNQHDFRMMLFALCILVFADICKFKCVSVREFIYKQDLWFRWLFYIVSFVFVLVFGIWGSGYDASSFIYFQF